MELRFNSLFFFIVFSIILRLSCEATEQQTGNDASRSLNDDTCTRDTCIQGKTYFDRYDTHKPGDHLEHFDQEKNAAEDLTVTEDSKEEVREDIYIKFRRYQFPVLSRIDPGNVGDIVEVELEDGQIYKRITRAVNPPLFEIPNYLSDKECQKIISAALNNGLEESGVVGADINEERTKADQLSEISRVSETTWLGAETMPSDLWHRLVKRLSKLTQLPQEQIEISEQMQVVSYVRGGHYHAHIDSSNTENKLHLPCCFQAPQCMDVDIHSEGYEECCRVCRYITVLYYLNDVEKGGETAFPLADMPDDVIKEKMTNPESQSWHDLSHYCYNSSVIVTPKRGSAVMWYSHVLDENGYLGHVDARSNHGGCDIIKGNKWVANNWIVGTMFRDRKKSSMIYN